MGPIPREKVNLSLLTPKVFLCNPINAVMVGYKKGWGTHQLCLQSYCTHHMEYISDVCIIQECHRYLSFTNKFVYYPISPKIFLWNRYTEVCSAIKRMRATSMMSSKCFCTSCGMHKRGLYHSGGAFVQILQRTSPFIATECRKSSSEALKRLNGGMFGCKKEWVPLQLCLPNVSTHRMWYIQDIWIIQEVPWDRYPMNESIYHS